jgi:hypothetical protein
MTVDWLSDETVLRYVGGLSTKWLPWARVTALLFGVALLALCARGRLGRVLERRRRPLTLLALLVVVACGLYYAWKLRWVADDAFISFRYARNLAQGQGLVFNLGARVEGYTNFLWTLILAGFLRAGFDAGQVSLVLSLACLAGCLIVTTRLVQRELEARGRGVFISLAAILLAGNYTFSSFGTSGLETMFASLLVLLAVERAAMGALASAGVAGIAATMAHPDHAIFYVALGVVIAARGRPWRGLAAALQRPKRTLALEIVASARRWRQNALGYALPFFGLYVPYFAWRTSYYGALFPNTYYAKSGSGWYLSQGLDYLGMSGLASGAWAVVPLALLGIWRHRASLTAQFTALAVPLYLVYVAKIGGDFMLGRLLCPALPLVFIMAELGLMTFLLGAARWRPVLGLAFVPLAALAATRVKLIEPWEMYRGVADERTFYRLRSFDPLVVDSPRTDQAQALKEAFADAPRAPKVGVYCVGIVGYETTMPLFDYFGLTEPAIARKQIKTRGRPGHEKAGTLGDALHADTDFVEEVTYPAPYDAFTSFSFGPNLFQLVQYDAAFINPLRASGRVAVRDFEDHLQGWRAPRKTRRLACDAWFMSHFYFRANEREHGRKVGQRALARLADRLPPGLVDWVIYGDSPLDAGLQPLTRWSFEAPLALDWTMTGDAFAREPRREALGDQQRVLNHEGGFVTSYHAAHEDAGLGELRSPPFVLRGDAITLKVGGGHSRRLSVQLELDRKVVASVSGCDSEIMHRWAWSTARFRGRLARVVIVDQAQGDWGHITVDEIVEWQASGSAPPATAPSAVVDGPIEE